MTRLLWLPAILAAVALAYQVATARPATIHEDDPRWDCSTMGNRICGPAIAR